MLIEDYTKIKDSCLAKYGGDSYFHFLEVEEIRNSEDNKIFVYFGWDAIKWDTDYVSNDEDYEQKDIEDFVLECSIYQMMRLGENYDDVDNFYALGDTVIKPIEFIRQFAA